jgi:hypothetical protein
LLLAALGAFTVATFCWIAIGLVTPGDFFANGSRLIVIPLVLAAAVGGYVAWRTRSRALRIALIVVSAMCAYFWIAVPSGWWASPPPGTPGSPVRAPGGGTLKVPSL